MQNPGADFSELYLQSTQAFVGSSANLDSKFLSDIFSLICDASGAANNEYRKERENVLANLKSTMGWKKYILNLYQLICFSELTQKDALERVSYDLCITIERQATIETVGLDELIVLIAANVYALTVKEHPIKIMNFLARALKGLFKLDFIERDDVQKAIERYLISSLATTTSSQALGIILTLRQIIENGSLTSLEFDRLEIYLQALAELSMIKLGQLILPVQEVTRDLISILEIVFHCSDLCYFLIEKLTKSFLQKDSSKKANQQPYFDTSFPRDFFFHKHLFLQQIISFAEKILGIDLTQKGCKVVSMSFLKDIDALLNRSKRYALKTIKVLFDYTFKIKSIYEPEFSEPEKIVFTNITQSFAEHLKFFILQLYSVVSAGFTMNISMSPEQNDIISECFAILSKMTDMYEFYNIFLDNRTEIIVNIIINILLTTKLDYDYLKEDPRDFVLRELDIVEERDSSTLRINTAQFFDKFCEKIDGTLSWVITFLVKSINMSLEQQGDYSDLQQFQQSIFFSGVDAMNRIETSLLCMTILTKQISNRKDLIESLDRFFANDFKNLFNINSSVILKCRICLFMKEMIPNLFERRHYYFKEVIKYLFECLVSFDNLAVSLQALYALESTVSKDNDYERSRPVITDMIAYMEKIIDEANEEYYFDFVVNVLNDYEEEFLTKGARIVKRLCARTWKEFQNLKEERTNIIITKCLDAIRNIVASLDMMESQYVDFEDDLQNLFSLLDKISYIDFEDSLLSIVTEVAKNVSMNTTLFMIVKRNLLKILEKNPYCFEMFFELFYNWCYNGVLFILTEDPELLTEMIKVCLRALELYSFQRVEKIEKDYEQFCMISLSLQLIIQSFGEQSVGPFVPDIIAMMDKILILIDSDKMGVICFRFLQVYFCLMFECASDTWQHLKNPNLLQLLIRKMPNYYLEYFRDDKLSQKVITLGLCAILFNRTSLDLGSDLLHDCFVNVIRVLEDIPISNPLTYQIEPSKMEETQNSKSYFNIDPSKFKEDTVSLLSISVQDKKLQELIQRTEFCIMKVDEFKSFSEVFQILQESNPNFVNAISQTFDQKTILSLKNILSTKNIELGDSNKTEGRKNVRVKKRTENNMANPPNSGMGSYGGNNTMSE